MLGAGAALVTPLPHELDATANEANKKPRRFTEVKRRGRNREEAECLLWGDKEDQSIAESHEMRMVMLNRLPTNPPVHVDHTRSNPYVQLFVATDRKNLSDPRKPIDTINRYFLTRKVLRQIMPFNPGGRHFSRS
jgi:hypothetical protein